MGKFLSGEFHDANIALVAAEHGSHRTKSTFSTGLWLHDIEHVPAGGAGAQQALVKTNCRLCGVRGAQVEKVL